MDTTIESKNNPGMGLGVDLDSLHDIDRSRILIVDDEPDSVQLLKTILRVAGFNVIGARDGSECLKKVPEYNPDLILLDLLMPELDGWQTMEYLKKISETPIIVVSAVSEKEKMINALKGGVDDYITKPFHNPEVIARINAVLRRSEKPKEVSRLVFPHIDLIVDAMNQAALLNDTPIHLTKKEFGLLFTLAKHAPSIVSYESIAEEIWGEYQEGMRERIKYLIHLIRRKFEEVKPDIDLILNIDRMGYKLNIDPS